ncbi:unnamed protein product [Hymenolepis diminuta]|uniref:Mediator of RNA polymerase II transcription subunit 20 n=2 Tax=Hymenolepis diminuta TaxID=6216 RepID=A0A3P6VYK1_HYMDI|nr:unnamed protein product [Hymenolepis diminuta]
MIEQLHSRVGRPAMQTIERAPEWECQLSRLETVHGEVVELLEGQDLNVLLHTRADIKEKLGKLMQLEVAGNLPSATVPRTQFTPQPLCLGYLVFPDDPDSMKTKQPVPTLPQVVGMPAATQTDARLLSFDEEARPTTKDIASEANVLPAVKQVRHRASNTENRSMVDQETNTRPRGINVSITFGGDEQVDLVDSYLMAIKDIEESGQDVALAGMDNLTRARLRRKLKERWNTIDSPEMRETNAAGSSMVNSGGYAKAATPTTSSSKYIRRRYSDNHKKMPGMSAVIRVPGNEKQILDDKISRLEIFGAVEVGKVRLESCVYRSLMDQAKYRSFQIFTLSDFPATCFVMNDAEPDRMLTADLSFREFPTLMKGVVEYEKKLQVEGNGVKYRLGDFQINFLTISTGQSAAIKGLLLEIGFIPTCLPKYSGELLIAFGTQHFPELFSGPSGSNALTPTLKKAFTDNGSADILPKSTPEKLMMGDSMTVLSRASARITVAQYIEKIREIRSHQ